MRACAEISLTFLSCTQQLSSHSTGIVQWHTRAFIELIKLKFNINRNFLETNLLVNMKRMHFRTYFLDNYTLVNGLQQHTLHLSHMCLHKDQRIYCGCMLCYEDSLGLRHTQVYNLSRGLQNTRLDMCIIRCCIVHLNHKVMGYKDREVIPLKE